MWSLAISIVIIIIVLIFIHVMMTQYNNDEKVNKHFEDLNISVAIKYNVFQNLKSRSIGTFKKDGSAKPNIKKKLLVFIHGTPGSSMDFVKFMGDDTLLENYDLMSIDRLGYGNSEIDNLDFSIENQSNHIMHILADLSYDKFVLCGHSYGGPIALYMGVQMREKIHSVVLLAPVIDPDNEKIFWYASLTKYIPFKWVFPKSFEIASYEKLIHAVSLKEVEKEWEHIDFPVYHMHGRKDGLAPPINIDYIENQVSKPYLVQEILPKAGHLLPFLNYEEVKVLLLKVDKENL